jgi:electron transport complex protein RnfG
MATDIARPGWRPTVLLVLLAVALALLVGLLVEVNRERIADNEARQVARVLRLLLPAGYDNQPELDRVMVVAPELLGSEEPLPIYRARRGGQPLAAVITAVAPQGYVAPIRLLVSVGTDASVLGVRAIAHRETPGVGDRIDPARSAWTRVFDNRSLDDPPSDMWKVRRDGGTFDQMTGATITSRAVVAAVRNAVLYFEQHRVEVFRQEADR